MIEEQDQLEEEQDLTEVLRRIRRIEIFTKRVANELFSGEYHSVFKGQGMEFDEVREYQPGDDVRSIDWNVTARTGTPHIKRFMEERELVVMFLLDVSASGRFGTTDKTKIDLAAEICSVLAFSAIQNNDKVGAIIFSDEVEEYIPPDKGRKHVLHVIRNLLFHRPKGRGTDVAAALEYLLRVVRRRAVVFLLSDFIAEDFSKPLGAAANRFDLVSIKIGDPRERVLEGGGLVRLWDQERGVERVVDLSGRGSRERFRKLIEEDTARRDALFRKYGVDTIEIETGEDYIKPLTLFFRARARRR
jgi:uncharacterized protein (DUF58 family)